MKTKLFLTLIFSVLISTISFSQSISKIKPVHIIWDTGIEKVTLKKASNFGIEQPDSISLEIYFDKAVTETLKTEELNFECKWYYYMTTKKQLMVTQLVNFNKSNFQEDGSYLLTTTKKNLNKGWWEVQIIALTDDGLIELSNITDFQIFIK